MGELEPTDTAFNPEEIALLQKLIALRDGWLTKATPHSGVVRELYLRLRIPDGKVAKNREYAVQTIRESSDLIEETLHDYADDPELQIIADDLQTIKTGLLTFTPESTET